MKSLFIAGNWKSNKMVAEAKEWMQKFTATWENITVVICAPFTLLSGLKEMTQELKSQVLLGAQDVSPFPAGAYTGEVNALQVKEFADWVIIGHSERRKNFGETDDMLQKKVTEAKSAGLKIIYCVPDDATLVPVGVDVVAYEPVWAIGTGKSDSPENANTVIAAIKAKTAVPTVIYGGSVTEENIASFVSQAAIDGVLPGGASLDPEKFAALIANAR